MRTHGASATLCPYVRKMMAYWNYPIGEGYNCEDMAYYMTENHPDVWDAWKESDGK